MSPTDLWCRSTELLQLGRFEAANPRQTQVREEGQPVQQDGYSFDSDFVAVRQVNAFKCRAALRQGEDAFVCHIGNLRAMLTLPRMETTYLY